MEEKKTATGLSENVASVLCYVLGWITGIIFLLIEQNNKTVRFHAFQSIIVFGALSLIGIVFSPVPFLGGLISWVVSGVGFALWIVLMVMAAQGKKFKLPLSGDLAEKWAGG